MTNRTHTAVLTGVPLAFAGILTLHPMVSDYEGLSEVTTRFQAVHLAMVLVLPLLAIGLHRLLADLPGRAAAVGRFAVIPFAMFYVPYVSFEGIALGVLGQELNALPAAEREAVGPTLVEEFARNPIVGEPSLFWALGSAAWITATVCAVLAFRRAGAPMRLQVALGLTVLIATHAPPLAPVGLMAFAAAGWMTRPRTAVTA
jgi:hypothetical protein